MLGNQFVWNLSALYDDTRMHRLIHGAVYLNGIHSVSEMRGLRFLRMHILDLQTASGSFAHRKLWMRTDADPITSHLHFFVNRNRSLR